MLSGYAKLISDNADITNTTSDVYIDDGDKHYKISVANQVTIALNGTNYAFDVIGFNHDDLTDVSAYGATTNTGKAGITFQMHRLFATTYQMNSSATNYGGWKSSDMRISTMPLMKGYMPTAWQTAIKTVNKKSGRGNASSSGTEFASDNCFLLAEIEIFGSTTYSVSGEGTQYTYYKAGNPTQKYKSGVSYSSGWGERSPRSGYSDTFCEVDNMGTPNRLTADSRTEGHVAFGFCI